MKCDDKNWVPSFEPLKEAEIKEKNKWGIGLIVCVCTLIVLIITLSTDIFKSTMTNFGQNINKTFPVTFTAPEESAKIVLGFITAFVALITYQVFSEYNLYRLSADSYEGKIKSWKKECGHNR